MSSESTSLVSLSGLNVPSDPTDTKLVGSIVVTWRDHVLLVRRDFDERVMAGQWELPGGKVNHKESVQEAILRELYEETGLKLVGAPVDLIMLRIPDYAQCVQITELNPESPPDEPFGDVCGAWFPYSMVESLPLTWAARAVLCSGLIQRHYGVK